MEERLPPRLSKQQKFILFDILESGGSMGFSPLSWDVAREIGEGNGDRYLDRKKKLEDIVNRAQNGEKIPDWEAKLANVLDILAYRSRRYNKEVLGYGHSQSFSRSVRRLEERGLVERLGFKDSKVTFRVRLTEKGKEAAREIKRRANDNDIH